MLSRRRPSAKRQFTWRQLAFEVFVVVLGVTLALGANELRQHFVDQREERVALRGIAGEMAYNCERLTQAQTYHQRVLAELDSVRVANASAVQGDGMIAMRQMPTWRGYNPAFVTTAAYETAQAKGALALFPYEQALGIGRYYTLVEMYQGLVRQALGVVMQTGEPTLAQVEVVLRISAELQRELAPQSCEGARQLGGEPTESASDSPASDS
ncbi:MAG: hypothetical protein ABJF88_06080 [Rhodothermales bacterium]